MLRCLWFSSRLYCGILDIEKSKCLFMNTQNMLMLVEHRQQKRTPRSSSGDDKMKLNVV